MWWRNVLEVIVLQILLLYHLMEGAPFEQFNKLNGLFFPRLQTEGSGGTHRL